MVLASAMLLGVAVVASCIPIDLFSFQGCNAVRLSSVGKRDLVYWGVVFPATQRTMTNKRLAQVASDTARSGRTAMQQRPWMHDRAVQELLDIGMLPETYATSSDFVSGSGLATVVDMCVYQDQNFHRLAFEEQADDDDAFLLSPITCDAPVVAIDQAADSMAHLPTFDTHATILGPYEQLTQSFMHSWRPAIGLLLAHNISIDPTDNQLSHTVAQAVAGMTLVLEHRLDSKHRRMQAIQTQLAIGPFLHVLPLSSMPSIDEVLLDMRILHREQNIQYQLDPHLVQQWSTDDSDFVTNRIRELVQQHRSLRVGSVVLFPFDVAEPLTDEPHDAAPTQERNQEQRLTVSAKCRTLNLTLGTQRHRFVQQHLNEQPPVLQQDLSVVE
jgi:hypothetical protein